MNRKKIDAVKEELAYHKPSPEQTEVIEKFRAINMEYIEKVGEVLPDNRDTSIFCTEFVNACRRGVAALIVPQ